MGSYCEIQQVLGGVYMTPGPLSCRGEFTRGSFSWPCKRDTKSSSMKLAPVRVFSRKHPLRFGFCDTSINVSVSVISLGLSSADNTYLSRPCLFLISREPHPIIFSKRIISDAKITSVVKVWVCAFLFVPWEFLFVPWGFVFALTPMGHCRIPAHKQ